MKNRVWHSLRLVFIRNAKKRASYLKENNIFGFLGDNIVYQGWKIPLYPSLIKIHNNVTISTNVTFLTHDVIHRHLKWMYPDNSYYEKIFPIEIHDNCFIGSGVIINGGVSIGPNSIIASGAIVTKDVLPNTIVGGNPARVISTIENLEVKRRNAKTETFEEAWKNHYTRLSNRRD